MKYRISPGYKYKDLSDSDNYPPVAGRYTESQDLPQEVRTTKKQSTSTPFPESTPFLLLACIGLWLLFGGYEKVAGGASVQTRPGVEYPANTI